MQFYVEERELVIRMMVAGLELSRADAEELADRMSCGDHVMRRAAKAAVNYVMEQLNGEIVDDSRQTITIN
jgi:hypothetical protein